MHVFSWCQNQRPWMTLKGHYAPCGPWCCYVCILSFTFSLLLDIKERLHERNSKRCNSVTGLCYCLISSTSAVKLIPADVHRIFYIYYMHEDLIPGPVSICINPSYYYQC